MPGNWTGTTPAVDAAADFMLSTAPAQRDLPHLTGLTPDLYRDDPARPGGCIWMPAGADWETHNLIPVIVPGATRPLRLHRKAAFRLVLGFGECVVFEELPDAEMQSFCLRHMNWDPTEDLTTHGYGFAIDRDWNRNHKMERIEGDLSRWAPSLQRWGNTLGDHWKDSATKKIRDAMHVQAVRVR